MKPAIVVVCATYLAIMPACRPVEQIPADPWRTADAIVSRIDQPTFPAKDFVITAYGAKEGGIDDCTEGFRRAIDECSKSGGRVVVPKGSFLTGAIHLKSNVNLHLEEGAVIKFHRDPQKYLPLVFTRWEGVECMNYSPFIYAFEQSNIAITGNGTLDGQASDEYWWSWKGKKDEFGWKEGMPHQLDGRNKLFAMGEKNVPVAERRFGDGFYLRPNFIQPYRCKNVLIDGVKIINSPMWEVHPVLCENVTIQNVHIQTHGPNNDGVDPESCKDVLIRNCFFDTGDDCIAIKSGRNNDGRRLNIPSENIVIQGCTFKDGHGGVTIGSEISGGARNIFAENCEVESPVLYNALRLKTNAMRGGTIENVYVRNFNVKLVGRAAIDIDLFYEEGRNGNFLPTVRNVHVEHMTVKKCNVAFNLVGYQEAPLQNVSLTDCDFKEATNGYKVEQVDGFRAKNTLINGKELNR